MADNDQPEELTMLAPEQIDAMEAGPDINVLVAEKVMGWRWLAWRGIPMRSHPDYPAKRFVRQFLSPAWQAAMEDIYSDVRRATGDEPLSYAYCSSRGPERAPDYSTKWNPAGEVLEKLGLWLTPSGPDTWEAGDGEVSDEDGRWAVAADPKLAICRAALKTTMDTPGGGRR